MGWTETRAMQRKPNGQPDIKKELDSLYTWSNQVHTSKVLKSQIVRGEFNKSVYYAAVERKEQPYHAAMRTDGTDGREVYCAVVLIENPTAPEFDFMYKDMDEFAGPAEAHCPASIFDLLTPVDHEWANEWRAKCRKNAGEKAFRSKLSKLPIGSLLEWTVPEGCWFQAGLLEYKPGQRLYVSRELVGGAKKWVIDTPLGLIGMPLKYLTQESTKIAERTAVA